jgi:hypothetical protein
VRAPAVEPEGDAVGAPETEPEPTMAPAAAAPAVEPGEAVAGAGWRPPEGDGVYTGVLRRPGGVREVAPIVTALSVRFEDRSAGTHPERRHGGGDEEAGGGGGRRRSGGTRWSDERRSAATVALIGWRRFDAEDLEAQRKRWWEGTAVPCTKFSTSTSRGTTVCVHTQPYCVLGF